MPPRGDRPILVFGGGVAGLAAAEALGARGVPFLLLEKEDEPGGLCRSTTARGYTFDRSGHFLHSADAGTRARIARRGVSWTVVRRDARVFLRGRLTPFPFQANLHGHDPGLVRRCLSDFAAERIREAVDGGGEPGNLAEWFLRRFGGGMCRAFFFPYNRKMWRRPLESMGYDWTSWAVPVPSFDAVLAGARGEPREGMGYNPVFLYPRAGGMGRLVRALAAPARGRIRTATGIAGVDLSRRVAKTAQGREIPFRAAISTIPLPRLAAFSEGLPRRAAAAAARLDWVKVLVVNLGIRRPGRFPGHWHYLPERAWPFFRVGCLSNVCAAAAPPGCGSFFADKSFPAGARIDVGREVAAAVEGFRSLGIVTARSRVEEIRPFVLDPAYVVFDRARDGAVSLLRNELERNGLFPAGRYGAWDYFGIEASIGDGVRAALAAIRFAAR